ncbi:hypothetical protein Fluta_1733 [Fluviicola taffensis DSM 16823]|uniref:Uncharacterized protein n=2 Tax=Fluviicola TaxID=332102 RepID=F2IHG0_FLUTR|nr:hypothetical protein Fluta_1733 [Fluviicola taffensis DSM 16823]
MKFAFGKSFLIPLFIAPNPTLNNTSPKNAVFDLLYPATFSPSAGV